MSAGVPVISTRVGAIPEMVEDGVGGFLIEAGNAAPLAERVSWAIDNRAQLPAMGERGRERAIELLRGRTQLPATARYAGRGRAEAGVGWWRPKL